MALSDVFDGAGAAIDLFGGAAGSFISAGGYAKEAAAYGTAAAISLSNADLMEKNKGLSRESTALQLRQLTVQEVANKIKQSQTARQMYQVQGATRAAIGAAGLTEGGSALDIIRSNAQQAKLEQAIVGTEGAVIAGQKDLTAKQGEIDLQNIELQQRSYKQQSLAYLGQQGAAEGAADAAKASGGAKTAGGILKTIGSIIGFFL